MTDDENAVLEVLFQMVSSLFATLPGMMLAFFCLRERRAQFKVDTKGLISPKGGFRYYMKRYGKRDLIAFAVFVTTMYLMMAFLAHNLMSCQWPPRPRI